MSATMYKGKMRLINTRAHALYDYAVGLVLIFSPVIFGYETDPFPQRVMMAAALCIWMTTLMSRLEYAALPFITLPLHFTIDILIGIALATSPWIFGFRDEIFKPHLIIGLSLIAVSLISDRISDREVKLILAKGRSKSKKPARKYSENFATPQLKLMVDPFYPLAIKEYKKEAEFNKMKSQA
jgi:hypothetical protein